jgi:hypothetical protein
MRYRMITLILALSAAAWAQTATQNAAPQAGTAASPQAGCCCDKADAKDAHSCCAHHDMNAHDMGAHDMSAKDGKEAMSCGGKDSKSCCSGKDGMSCKRTNKDKADNDKTAASCGDCMKNHEKDCCATAKNGDNKPAMSCCKEHCAAHASAGAGN